MNEDEIFYPVKGYEDYFEVTKSGIIKSLGRYINTKGGGKRYKKPIIMTPSLYKNHGYLYVNFKVTDRDIIVKLKVHRIVATTFLLNPDNLPMVNHIDGNKLNNHVSNLEFCTASHNTQHSFNIGRIIHNRKITEEGLIDIFSNTKFDGLDRFKKGSVSINDMAIKYNVSGVTIRNVLKGKKYQTITSKFI